MFIKKVVGAKKKSIEKNENRSVEARKKIAEIVGKPACEELLDQRLGFR